MSIELIKSPYGTVSYYSYNNGVESIIVETQDNYLRFFRANVWVDFERDQAVELSLNEYVELLQSFNIDAKTIFDSLGYDIEIVEPIQPDPEVSDIDPTESEPDSEDA